MTDDVAKPILPDSCPGFLAETHTEFERARRLFPDPAGLMTALTEEVGELAKALLDEPWERVRKEAVQVAAMAMRIAYEGDPTLDKVRASRREKGQNLPNYGKVSLKEPPPGGDAPMNWRKSEY